MTGPGAPDLHVLTLCGYPVSNYFNIARAALLEKHLDFGLEILRADKKPEFLQQSPMGKIPFLRTPSGAIAETVAIVEYLEDATDSPKLHPRDPFLRARGRQIINVMQLYVEAQSRTLFPGVFLNQLNSDAVVGSVRITLDRATTALQHLMKPAPYLFGPTLSLADLFAFYCLDIADRVTRFVYSRSILREIGGLDDWLTAIAERDSSRLVFADFYRYLDNYLTNNNAPYDLYADADLVAVAPPPRPA